MSAPTGSSNPSLGHLETALVKKAKWYALFAPDTSAPPVPLGQLSFFLLILLAVDALSPVAFTQPWVVSDCTVIV